MTLKEINYTTSVISVFAGVGLVLFLFFTGNSYISNNYLIVLVSIGVILAFPYFLLKFFFYVTSHNKNEELKLEELPKDQEDIERTH